MCRDVLGRVINDVEEHFEWLQFKNHIMDALMTYFVTYGDGGKEGTIDCILIRWSTVVANLCTPVLGSRSFDKDKVTIRLFN